MTHEELGGSKAHTSLSGVAHRAFENDIDALLNVRYLMSFLPQNNRDKPLRLKATDVADRLATGLDTVVPLDTSVAYDMYDVIKGVRHPSSSRHWGTLI